MTALIRPLEIRLGRCSALGIHKCDPGPGCPWATEACKRFCYAMNAISRWRNTQNRVSGRYYMIERIMEDEQRWERWRARHFRGLGAVRVATRFEAFKGPAEVERIRSWLVGAPETRFWIPTRAWRNHEMRGLIESRIKTLPNARVQASLDKTTTGADFRMLRDWGWSTMGVWARSEDGSHPFNGSAHRCAKTWNGAHGAKACAKCAGEGTGCFSAKRVDVLLRLHS